MREPQFSTKTETPKQRSLRMKKNRIIRKQKLYGTVFSIDEPESKQTTSNHHNEKQYIQKLKNRQAAQKSREQKKMYVTQLEEEIKFLKHKLSILSHCENCQKQFQNPIQEIEVYPTEMAPLHQRQPQFLEQEEDQSELLRMSSTEEHSSIGIYLFVFMLMSGVFCIGTRMDVSDRTEPMRRDLTQMFNVPQNDKSLVLQSVYEYQNNMKSTYSTLNQVDINPEAYQNGLLSMNQVRSPLPITDQQQIQNIITSFQNYKLNEYDEKNLRSKVSLIDANKSLMFCSRPKIYKSNPNNEGVFSSFIDIFVKGAEIMNIFPQESPHVSNPNNLQINGLYKITASVQEIEQIGNQNFIY